MSKIGVFGPRVLGKKRYEEEKAIVKSKAHIYGPRVTGGVYKGPAHTIGDKPQEGYMSVNKLISLVLGNPALVKKLAGSEINRPGGPRLKALKALRFAEMDKDEPDADVMTMLTKEIRKIEEILAPEGTDDTEDEPETDEEIVVRKEAPGTEYDHDEPSAEIVLDEADEDFELYVRDEEE